MAAETELESMVVRLVGDGSSYQKMLQEAESQTKASTAAVEAATRNIEAISGGLRDFASNAIQALTSLGVAGSLAGSFSRFQSYEQDMIRLKAAIRATGQEVEPTLAWIDELSGEMSKTTLATRASIVAMARYGEQLGESREKIEEQVRMSVALSAALGGEAREYQRAVRMIQQGNFQFAARYLGLGRIKDAEDAQVKIQALVNAGLAAQGDLMNSSAGKIQMMGRSMASLNRLMGEIVADALVPMIDAVRAAVDWFNKLGPAIKQVTAVLLTGLGVMLAWRPTLAALAPLINAIVGPLRLVASLLLGMPSAWTLITGAISLVVAAHTQSLLLTVRLGVAILGLLNPLRLVAVTWGIIKGAIALAGAIFNLSFGGIGLLIGSLIVAAGGVSLLVAKFGGIMGVWEAIKNAAFRAWDYIKEKVKEFQVWAMPVWKALQGFGAALWERIQQAAMAAWGAIRSVWEGLQRLALSILGSVSTSATLSWNDVRDAIVTALIAGEFAIRNFGMVAELAWAGTKLKFVQLVDTISFFFTDQLPAMLDWWRENWGAVVINVIDYTLTVVKNGFMTWQAYQERFGQFVVDNFVEMFKICWTATTNFFSNFTELMKNIPKLISGELSFADFMKPMMEGIEFNFKAFNFDGILRPLDQGFEAWQTKALNLPQRQASILEQQLRDEFDRLGAAVNESWEKFRDTRMAEIFGADSPQLKKATDDAGKAGLHVGEAFGKGAKGELGKFEAAVYGSAEALARIMEYRERVLEGKEGKGHGGHGASDLAGGAPEVRAGAGAPEPLGGNQSVTLLAQMLAVLVQIRDRKMPAPGPQPQPAKL